MNIYFGFTLVIVVPFIFITLLSKNRKFFEKESVVGFGLGVYTALIILLLKEGFELSSKVTSIWFLVGFFISILIGYFFKGFHHHHTSEEHTHHSKIDAIKILVSDFFHNIVDGMALLSAFMLNPITAGTTLFGIIGHQTIQQVGQQILLADSGIKPSHAFFVSLLVSLSIFLGLVFSGNEFLENIFIAVSAGIICWKVIADIRHTTWSSKSVLGFMVGVTLLTASLVLVPHGH